MKYSELKTDKARISFLKEKLGSDWSWAERGLLVIYQKQTFDEQTSRDVKWENGIGFTHSDASFMSAMAQLVQKGIILSFKQKSCVFRQMPKYARQLMNHVKGK